MIKRFFAPDRIWPTGLFIFGTVFIAVNLAFVTMAMQNRPELVSADYYAEGYNLREISERNAASDATGWQVTVRALPAEMAAQPLVELTVQGSNGQPADSLAGEVGFYRPSDKRLDIQPQAMRFIGGGRYLVVLPRALETGAWQARVHLSRGRLEYDKRIAFSAGSKL